MLMKKGIRAEDALSIAFCLVVAFLTFWKKENIPRWWFHIGIDLLASLVCVAVPLATAERKDKFSFHLRYWYILVVVPLNFMNLKGVIHGINPNNFDPLLIKIDRWICGGVDPTVWMEKIINPWLTEYLQWAYMSYFVIPIIVGVALYKKKRYLAFRFSATIVLIAFYLSYLGYLLVPAIGPRFTIHHQVPLKGVFLTSQLKQLLNFLEPTPHDCFPSGHTAVSFVCMMLAAKFERKLFYILLIIVISLIFSTVYHRYHYVIDIIAGILLALFSFWIGPKFFKWWEKEDNINNL